VTIPCPRGGQPEVVVGRVLGWTSVSDAAWANAPVVAAVVLLPDASSDVRVIPTSRGGHHSRVEALHD
jgi:hypothetical protein